MGTQEPIKNKPSVLKIREKMQPKTKRFAVLCISLIITVCVIQDPETNKALIMLLSGGLLALLDPR